MKRITRTYMIGCKWCNGEGIVADLSTMGIFTSAKRKCQVCGGTGAILVTEVEEELMEITGKEILLDISKSPRDFIQEKMEEFIFTPIPKEWKTLRKECDLSLRQVEKLSGVSISTISRMERGGVAELETHRKLRSFYFNYLLKLKDATDKAK